MDNEGIAIIGMSGRFPGARNIEEYWRNLKAGKDCITFFTTEDAKDAGVKEEDYTNKDYVCAGGILEDVEYFDEGFFGMSPREAADMDPQQRLFLECSYEALEDAGYAEDKYEDPVGVFAGANMSTYFLYHLADKIGVRDDFSLTVGNDKDYIATRTSYIFNLKGPSISVQTACSTSMTAVAMACDSLDSFQCDMAIAGGVAVKLPQKMGYLYQEGMIASPDGHTKPFDEDGSGTVFTSVVGVVILKRLEDALRDGDNIYAVIKGIAVNNDGSDKVGFTAPSREGQAKVIETACYLAEVDPEEIGYIEAHGTGTKLGDPIELSALKKVFEKSTKKRGYCAIGSVKGNIGHAVSGAGIAGLIKTALVVKYGEIPPSIHFESPNQEIDFINSPFYVNTRLRKWDNGVRPRTAGVSSFGFGGTNVHAVLQEVEQRVNKNSLSEQSMHVLTLSAKSEQSLGAMRERLGRFLRDNPNIPFRDVIFTLHVGRRNFEHRLVLLCKDRKEAMEMLFDIDNAEVYQKKVDKKDIISEFNKEVLEGARKGRKEDLQLLAKYWLNGGFIDWEDYHSNEKNHRISLPTYVFDKKRHWVEQFSFKSLTTKQNNTIVTKSVDDWLYKLNWERSELIKEVNKEKVKGTHWLLFMDELGLGDQFKEYLTAKGANVSVVYSGTYFDVKDDTTYTINEHSKEDYEKLMKMFLNHNQDSYILHLWNITESRGSLIAPTDIGESSYKSFYSLLFIAQAMSKLNYEKKLKLAVVTNHMHLIANETILQPEKSLVLGPIKVIPKENNRICCQSIDLDITKDTLHKKKLFISNILEDILSKKSEYLVAYRGPFRWIQVSEEINLGESLRENYKKDGVTYVITGGLGGIGFETAKHLAGNKAVNLVLTGRSAVKNHEQKLNQLKDLGANVMYICADCTDESQMKHVFLTAMEEYGQIYGVFHAAGLVETDELVNKTVDTAEQILSAKVKGTLILDKWIKACHPEFVVLFSSISGVLGNAGLIDYCSANSFLDAYGWYQLIEEDTTVISINWDGFDNLGMVAATANQINHKVKGNIQVSEGLYLMDQIISAKLNPQVIVSKKHFPTMLSEIRSFMRGETVSIQRNHEEVNNRPEITTPYVAPNNQIQEEITKIWEELLGVHPIGIQDDYFDLGGHSLLATEMVLRLSQVFEKHITLRELFENSTVEQLALFYEGVKENIG